MTIAPDRGPEAYDYGWTVGHMIGTIGRRIDRKRHVERAGLPQDGTVPVTLVIAPGFPLLSLAVCTECLRLANRELGRATFGRTVVTTDGKPVLSSSGVEVAASVALSEPTFASMIIVLTSYDPDDACSPALLSWLRRQDRLGAVFGCADTGGYVLAKAGVLRGRRVAVHRESLPAYQETLSNAVMLDRVHAFDEGVVSSAGGVATMDMMLGLIARCHSERLADRIAHILNYRRVADDVDPSASGDSAIARVDRRLGRMVELMQSHLEARLPLDALCRMAHLDPSTARRLFVRRFQETPGRYYTGLRLNRARSLLADSALPIRDIAAMVGFADASAFARAYRRRFGALPSAARHWFSGTADDAQVDLRLLERRW
ncbi:MAG: helix-turn-helix domain-containing protein [Pseudomonadota bacterium]